MTASGPASPQKSSPDNLFVWGNSHHTTKLELRESFTLGKGQIQNIYAWLPACVRECVVLSTCNRVEIYGVSEKDPRDELSEILKRLSGFDADAFKTNSFWLTGPSVLKHAFELSAGMDSQIIGEVEILGQFKQAYAAADEQARTGPLLHRVFQKSFQAAKWMHTHTDISSGMVSFGNIAVELAERVCGELSEVRVMLLGTGTIAQRIAKALHHRGAKQWLLLSQNTDRALRLAESFSGASVASRAHTEDFLKNTDVLITATSNKADAFLLGVETLKTCMQGRNQRPLFALDLAFPRNLDAQIAQLPNVYLYNLDDLAEVSKQNQSLRKAAMQKARHQLNVRAAKLWERLCQ